MGISTVLEECIARLVRNEEGQSSFFIPVLRANYITLGLVLTVTAIQILPKRLASPHFLAWLQALFASSGCA